MRRRALGRTLSGLALVPAACGVRLRRPDAAVATPAGPQVGGQDGPIVPRIEVEAAYAEVTAGRAVLVDVRSVASHRARRAAGALAMPLDELERAPAAAAAALPVDKRAIFYCT